MDWRDVNQVIKLSLDKKTKVKKPIIKYVSRVNNILNSPKCLVENRVLTTGNIKG